MYVNSALAKHPEFAKSLDRSCVAFIDERSAQKASELLARHCDYLLKTSHAELEANLTNLVSNLRSKYIQQWCSVLTINN